MDPYRVYILETCDQDVMNVNAVKLC
jgi:hypothetical protein